MDPQPQTTTTLPLFEQKLFHVAQQLLQREEFLKKYQSFLGKWDDKPTKMVCKNVPNNDSAYNSDDCRSIDSLYSRRSVDIESELFNELRKNRQIPYRNYICHRCNKSGHMIANCPTRDPNPKTPYQGDNISRGNFRCPCGRHWQSDFVAANKAYICRGCQMPNYPVKMWRKDHKPAKQQFLGKINLTNGFFNIFESPNDFSKYNCV